MTVFLLFCLLSTAALALEPVKVADGVYALVGDLGQRSPDNLGNNATFGVIVTDDGVVLVDPGGSAKGAAAIEAEIAKITDKPVVLVINTGGQDHRWLGNGHFKARGARIVASTLAVADQKERVSLQLTALETLIGKDDLAGTEPVHADETFDDAMDLSLGGIDIRLRHLGEAHTPGDAVVWLPGAGIVFTGDIVYLDRLLGVISVSSSAAWVETFAAMTTLKPRVIVPGHGAPAGLDEAMASTLGYLEHLRGEIGAILERGGAVEDAIAIDQSAFAGLKNFENLSRRNAQQVFMEMEFE